MDIKGKKRKIWKDWKRLGRRKSVNKMERYGNDKEV
jgi:hypothetical protein